MCLKMSARPLSPVFCLAMAWSGTISMLIYHVRKICVYAADISSEKSYKVAEVLVLFLQTTKKENYCGLISCLLAPLSSRGRNLEIVLK